MTTTDELAHAIETEPEGVLCGFCGEPNDFADDCGFFYIISEEQPNKERPVCRSCYHKHNKFHIEKYGLGER